MNARVIAENNQFAEKLRVSMRASAISVSLATTRDIDGTPHGMAVTSSNSLSMDPPSMMVAINRNASSHAVLLRSGVFCLNLLHCGQMDVLELFHDSKKRVIRFNSTEWTTGPLGLPYLQTAISSLFCKIEGSHDYGTHTVFFGRIEDVHLSSTLEKCSPLIWMNGGLASIGGRKSHESAAR